MYGYPDLALSEKDYQDIKPSLPKFNAPPFPKSLIITGTPSQVTVFTLKEQYHEVKRVYYECKNIKRALL